MSKQEMEKKSTLRPFFPITIIFVIAGTLFLVTRPVAAHWRVDNDVLTVGNLVLYLATALSFFFYYKAIRNNKVYIFLRMIYGGMFLKMLICLAAAFIYISSVGKAVNKPALFICMFLYLVYSFAEIVVLMKLSKKKNG